MQKTSPATSRWRPWHLPRLVNRSSLATATRRPAHSWNGMAARSAAAESMKLCVDPESNRARSWTPFTTNSSCIVLPDRGWMPVSTCSEVIRFATLVVCSSASARITSITNNCLQTNLCPLENKSSQWKHLPSLRRCTISAGVSRLMVIGGPLTDVTDEAWLAPYPEVVGTAGW
jgi:hypothetical protein